MTALEDRINEHSELETHFKSDQNIELLKSLLNDPDFSTTSTGDGQNRRRVYNVRQSAFDVLQSWGIKVEKPVVEESLN